MGRWGIAVFWAVASAACTTYEYEEEVFLEVDGSGQLRVSGSSDILAALHALDDASTSSLTSRMSSRFSGPGFELDSVRETERNGRRFVHVQGTFAAWNDLCAHPAFTQRECRLDVNDDELHLYLVVPLEVL